MNALILQDGAHRLAGQWEEELRKLVEADELASTSAATYRRGLAKYLRWCEAGNLLAASRDTVLAWMGDLRVGGAKPSSVNVWLAGVRSFFAWAVESGQVTADPTERIRGMRRKGTSRRHSRAVLTGAEVRRLLAAPDSSTVRGLRDRAILHLFAYNALRRAEVCRADVAHLHTQDDRLVLDVHGKGRSEADEFVVVAKEEAVTALYDWLAVRGRKAGPLFWSLSPASSGRRLAPRSVQYIVRGYFDQVGIVDPRKTLHSLRHTAISNAIANGATPQKVQSMARHASITTTMIYYHELDRLSAPAEEFVRYE